MEFLLLSLFFISVLILFIGGKDDFGRKESVIRKEEGKVIEEIPNKLEEIEK